MPQLEVSTYISQLFWLLITFGGLYILAWKVFLPRLESILGEREEKVDRDLHLAQSHKQEAEALLQEYEAKLAEAKTEAQNIVRSTAQKLASESTEQQLALTKELDQQINEATRRIEAAKTEAIANIWPAVSETAAAASNRLLGKAPDETQVAKVIADLKKGVA